MKYTDIWNKLTERIGYWVDMREPYITYKSKYMESVWWLIKQIHEKGFLYTKVILFSHFLRWLVQV